MAFAPHPAIRLSPIIRKSITLFRLLDAERQIGVQLTETLAMVPAASICGLYFAHPQARYFAVGRLARDQVESYAARKGFRWPKRRSGSAPIWATEPGDLRFQSPHTLSARTTPPLAGYGLSSEFCRANQRSIDKQALTGRMYLGLFSIG